MSDVSALSTRIDAEFAAIEQKMKKFQAEQVQQHQERQKRLEQLQKTFGELTVIWRPRLELLSQKFGDRVQVKPRLIPSTREVSLDFQSRVARICLKFSAATDRDIRNLTISYDLEIVPVLMRFKSHDEIEFPLDGIDKAALAKWFDDRIVDFVQTYFSMGENDIYLKEHMVEDPIAHVRFPKMAAATTLEWQGKTYYFIGEETKQEFEKQQRGGK